MLVRHKKTGRIAEIHGRPGEELGCADWCVMVRTRYLSGKNKGKWYYPIWNLENLELVPG